MSTVIIQGNETKIKAVIDLEYGPSCDYLFLAFGAASVGIFRSDERKAFIAALIEADAELDAAIKARTEKAGVAA